MKTTDLIKEIIIEQSNIVGDKIAFERAEATKVIHVNQNKINVDGSPEEALKKLIKSYEEIFGEASVEVCEDVIKKFKSIQK
jgi:ABC-type histidine transport system ATPase subunit